MKFLSPTSIKLFNSDPETFYLRYLAKVKAKREPQTQPMAVGAAFDAFVKSYLYKSLFGKEGDYELRSLFENQVEKHNWDWAWDAGGLVFNQYLKAGCVADLMIELNQAIGPPRFEFTVNSEVEGVPLLGKPDLFFINKLGARVIYDWKVNGYCSKALKSPMKGYVKLRDQGKVKEYKDCHLHLFKGIMINLALFLEDGNKDWADQLVIYSWLLGEEVGSEEVVFGIDQICGGPRLRFATHRLRVKPEYQFNLIDLIKDVWGSIQENWIFKDLEIEESQERCRLLEMEIEFEGIDRENEFKEMTS